MAGQRVRVPSQAGYVIMALGGVPEWLIGADCKSAARKGYAGSNPAPSTWFKYDGVGTGHWAIKIYIMEPMPT